MSNQLIKHNPSVLSFQIKQSMLIGLLEILQGLLDFV